MMSPRRCVLPQRLRGSRVKLGISRKLGYGERPQADQRGVEIVSPLELDVVFLEVWTEDQLPELSRIDSERRSTGDDRPSADVVIHREGRLPASVKVCGLRPGRPCLARRRPAAAKRQCMKSREVGRLRCGGRYAGSIGTRTPMRTVECRLMRSPPRKQRVPHTTRACWHR
jgi:hypothetical protein